MQDITTKSNLSLFEIWGHAGYCEESGESFGDVFICEVWVEGQSDADEIAKAFKIARGLFDVRAYYTCSGVIRPE